LEHRTRERGIHRVHKGTRGAGTTDHALKDAGNNNEEIGRKGISLAETVLAFDPGAKNSV
jgi:hypothetical protein